MPLRYEISEGIATITLDNPPVNVFTPALHKELYGLMKDFVADPGIRVGIWTGGGERAMSAGDDIKSPRPERTTGEVIERHLSPRREEEPLEYPGWEQEVMKLERYKPVVAAVNGPLYGAGLLYLLLMTDIRIAVPTARFGFPEIKYGMGGAGGVTRLGRQIPHAVAMSMLLTGDDLPADAALHHGMINEIVPPGDLMARAGAIAQKIASHPPIAVRTEMEAYYRGIDMSRDEAIAFSGHLYRLQRAACDPARPLARPSETAG